jgi:hypothetical protein
MKTTLLSVWFLCLTAGAMLPVVAFLILPWVVSLLFGDAYDTS